MLSCWCTVEAKVNVVVWVVGEDEMWNIVKFSFGKGIYTGEKFFKGKENSQNVWKKSKEKAFYLLKVKRKVIYSLK